MADVRRRTLTNAEGLNQLDRRLHTLEGKVTLLIFACIGLSFMSLLLLVMVLVL